MICTEEEAKTKWCRHKFTPCFFRGADNVILQQNSKCIASECMAWKWSGQSNMYGFCGVDNSNYEGV